MASIDRIERETIISSELKLTLQSSNSNDGISIIPMSLSRDSHQQYPRCLRQKSLNGKAYSPTLSHWFIYKYRFLLCLVEVWVCYGQQNWGHSTGKAHFVDV